MDPLNQLKAIHMPTPVSNFPLAYGWWLLAAFILLTTALIIRHWLMARRFNRAKKQALTHLSNNQLSQQEILETLKWLCLQYFPRAEIAALHGQQFGEFLTQLLPEQSQQAPFIQTIDHALITQYQLSSTENTDNEALTKAVTLWIKTALTKKNIQTMNERQQAVSGTLAVKEAQS
ncbi:DUF4381 domain-containing protein [Thalassotalea sp. G2M2-11]|uniref:DUF4381 domain-containing protein n=1 Tax=Thalassotalea sp. G2M2-11 TaxID=2787627 RepID=UPI0019CFD5CC|nr:DUF4381 domain-containing protein [Thalassotalea sp. G2M2-11]